MQKYPVSPKVVKELNLSTIQSKVQEAFGACTQDGEFLHAQFGALKDLKIGLEGKTLLVETIMDPKVPPDVQQDTVHRYYAFLEHVTGYTAKERAKKLQQAAKKGAPGA